MVSFSCFSPTGKKFYKKSQLIKYIENRNLPFDAHNFSFSVKSGALAKPLSVKLVLQERTKKASKSVGVKSLPDLEGVFIIIVGFFFLLHHCWCFFF